MAYSSAQSGGKAIRMTASLPQSSLGCLRNSCFLRNMWRSDRDNRVAIQKKRGETPKCQKVTVRWYKAQMGIILRNCNLKKRQLLTTKLAKAVPIRPKLFHVEQFRAPRARTPSIPGKFRIRLRFSGEKKLHVEQFATLRTDLNPHHRSQP